MGCTSVIQDKLVSNESIRVQFHRKRNEAGLSSFSSLLERMSYHRYTLYLCDKTWVACTPALPARTWVACVATDRAMNAARAKSEEGRMESFLSFSLRLLSRFMLVSFFARPKHTKRKRILSCLERGLSFRRPQPDSPGTLASSRVKC